MITNHLLLNRKEAAEFLGIDPISFDRYYRQRGLRCYMIGRNERYLATEIIEFTKANLVA